MWSLVTMLQKARHCFSQTQYFVRIGQSLEVGTWDKAIAVMDFFYKIIIEKGENSPVHNEYLLRVNLHS